MSPVGATVIANAKTPATILTSVLLVQCMGLYSRTSFVVVIAMPRIGMQERRLGEDFASAIELLTNTR